MQKALVIALLGSALGACVTNNVVELKPQAAGVKIIHEEEKPFRCKDLGLVQGRSRSTKKEEAQRGAEADLKNNAAALKANYVVLDADRGGQVGSSSHVDHFMSGKALKCEAEKEPEY